MNIHVKKSRGLKGDIDVPGDKSISHRAVMMLPLTKGKARIHNFLLSEDCNRSLCTMRKLGADIHQEGKSLIINGVTPNGLRPAITPLYVGNSGTTTRLLCGLLSGIKGKTFLYGDDSLNNRPMERIIRPLTDMGSVIRPLYSNGNAPLVIKGGELKGIEFQMENASAQVKSAIMLASIFGEGKTIIHEIKKSRDHTERMLAYLGYDIKVQGDDIELNCGGNLEARDIVVPGDISSAAFIIAATILIHDSEVIIRNVLYNHTRAGFIEVVKKMGARIEIIDVRTVNNEEVADIKVEYSELQAAVIEGEIIPRIIDELPLVAMLSAFAEGTTYIRDSEELKHKESNRIESTIYNLRQLGVNVTETNDGMIIEGRSYSTKGNVIFDSFMDHRIAMTFSIAGMLISDAVITECNNIETSFPDFLEIMSKLGADIKRSN